MLADKRRDTTEAVVESKEVTCDILLSFNCPYLGFIFIKNVFLV